MKILFLQPPVLNMMHIVPPDIDRDHFDITSRYLFPPLGLLYVLSYLKKNMPGHDMYFIDCAAEQINHEQLLKKIAEIQPDLVAITSYTPTLYDALLAIESTKTVNPKTHICVGGHHASSFPRETLSIKGVDSIIVGDGEEVFLELVKAVELKKSIHGIKGLYTADNINAYAGSILPDKRLLYKPILPFGYIDDLDKLPFPDRSYIHDVKYFSLGCVTDNPTSMISTRGCNNQCAFCNSPYKAIRLRSPENVVKEIAYCLSLGYKEIHFYDDFFNISPQRVMAICDEIDQAGLVFPWSFRGYVNMVTEASIARAKKSGCQLISFGVETGSDEGLKRIKKGITTKGIRNAFSICQKKGIRTVANFMIGLPHEKNPADIQRNIDFLIELKPDYAIIEILRLFPYTQLYNEASARGIIDAERFRSFLHDPRPDFIIDHWEEFFSARQLVRFQKQAYRKFYFRPSYFIQNIKNTQTLFEFKNKVLGFSGFLKSSLAN